MKKINWGYELFAKWCIGIGIVCLVVFILKLYFSGYVIANNIDNEAIEVTGQIGEFVGGFIGSIWVLASALLYFSALKLQSKELANQTKEIDENRRILNKQQFETSFYSLIRTQQEIKSDIKGTFHDIIPLQDSYQFRDLEYHGGDFFKRVVPELKKIFSVYKKEDFQKWNREQADEIILEFEIELDSPPKEPDLKSYFDEKHKKIFKSFNQDYTTSIYGLKESTIEKALTKDNDLFTCQCIYGHLFSRYEDSLGHYCRHLYNIVKFVDTEYERTIEECKKKDFPSDSDREKELGNIKEQFEGYIGFIHSILSSSEMAVLFYNSLLFKRARDLFVKWDLFDNLRKESLIKEEHELLIPGIKLKSNNNIFEVILRELNNE